MFNTKVMTKKYIIILVIFSFLFSCSAVRNDSKSKGIIVYLLSSETEKSIYDLIQKYYKKDNEVTFYINHQSSSRIKISLVKISQDDLIVASTNRKLFINDTYYPLIFSTDFNFYTEMRDGNPLICETDRDKEVEKMIKILSLNERMKNTDEGKYSFPRKTILFEYPYYWIVDTRGKLIETNINELENLEN